MKQAIVTGAMGVGLAVVLGQNACATPIVNINDVTGPVVVNGTGFSTFSSGTISGNPEAVWWYGTVNPLTTSLGIGTTAGIWTDPGSSKISDEYIVVASGTYAYGIFLSDPATVPASVVLTLGGSLGSITLNLSSLLGSASVSHETGLPTSIYSTSSLNVTATSSVPDDGSTVLLLGLGLLVVAVGLRLGPTALCNNQRWNN